jgi:hypothetical protein
MSDLERDSSKSPLSSRTIGFNSVSGLLVSAVWPLLPDSFRSHDWAVPALTAWFTIGNIILRFLTTEAVAWRSSHEKPPT